MKKFKTSPAAPTELYYFQKRGEECHRLAKHAYQENMWFGVCINSVHSAIAYADCVSVFLRQLRYSGTSHDEAVEYYATLQVKHPNFRQSIQRFGSILSIKNHAEYIGEAVTEKDAGHVLKQLERFRDFILAVLP